MRWFWTLPVAFVFALAAHASSVRAQEGNIGGGGIGGKELGPTGWDSGTRGQTQPDKRKGPLTPEEKKEAAKQPPVGTGVDLKGPPKQFPPAKTPQ